MNIEQIWEIIQEIDSLKRKIYFCDTYPNHERSKACDCCEAVNEFERLNNIVREVLAGWTKLRSYEPAILDMVHTLHRKAWIEGNLWTDGGQ